MKTAYEARIKIERYLDIYIEGEDLTEEAARKLIEADPESYETGFIQKSEVTEWDEDLEEREAFDPHAEPANADP